MSRYALILNFNSLYCNMYIHFMPPFLNSVALPKLHNYPLASLNLNKIFKYIKGRILDLSSLPLYSLFSFHLQITNPHSALNDRINGRCIFTLYANAFLLDRLEFQALSQSPARGIQCSLIFITQLSRFRYT